MFVHRETSGINSQLLPERPGNIVGNCSPEADKPCAEEGGETGDGFHWSRQITEAPDNETRRSKNGTVSEQENGDCCMSGSSEAVCSPQFMADDSPLDHSGRLFTCHDTDVKKRNKSLTQRALKATENGVKDQVLYLSTVVICNFLPVVLLLDFLSQDAEEYA